MKKNKKIRFLVIFLSLYSFSLSQTTFYWNQNYGTVSSLLGGIVIGSVNDISATYYNPGYLGLHDKPGLILGAKMYEYIDQRLKIDNMEDLELKSGKFSVSPSFFAGSINIDTVQTHKFFYTYLVRGRSKFTFDLKNAEENFNSTFEKLKTRELNALQNFSETWVGVSWGISPLSNSGLGISGYVAIMDGDKRESYIASASNDSGNVSIVNFISDYQYYDIRMLFKLGYLLDLNPFSFGITVTTPGFHIYGDGEYYFNFSLSDYYDDQGDLNKGLIIADYQEDLVTYAQNPLSIGLGASYKWKNSRFHFSLEWFDKVNSYQFLKIDSKNSTELAEISAFKLTNAARSIINFGFGYEIYINEKLSAYGSIYNDKNANVSKIQEFNFDNNTTLYHITAGTKFVFNTTDVTSGIEVAWGSQDINTELLYFSDFTNDAEGLASQDIHGEGTYFKIKLILSAAFQF